MWRLDLEIPPTSALGWSRFVYCHSGWFGPPPLLTFHRAGLAAAANFLHHSPKDHHSGRFVNYRDSMLPLCFRQYFRY